MSNQHMTDNELATANPQTGDGLGERNGSTFVVLIAVVCPETKTQKWIPVAEYKERGVAERTVSLNPGLIMMIVTNEHREMEG